VEKLARDFIPDNKKDRIPKLCLSDKMVEVAGIEPASKKPVTNESTCLVVFRSQLRQ